MRRGTRALHTRAGAAALVAVLATCAAGAMAKKTTISLSFWGSQSEIRDIWGHVKADFEAANPDITVRLIPDIGSDKLLTLALAGLTPDVFLSNFDMAIEYGLRGMAADLSPHIKKDKSFKLADYNKVAMDAFNYAGKQYGLATHYQTTAVWINRGMLAKAGLAIPRDTWTWADLEGASAKLTLDANKDGRPEVYGMGFSNGFEFLQPWFYSGGGRLVDDYSNPTKVTVNSPGGVTALNWLHTLIKKLGVATLVSAGDSFYTGKVAMWGYYAVGQRMTALTKNVDWDAVRLPAGPAGSVNLVVAGGFGVAKRSKTADASWRLLKFMVNGVYTGNNGVPSSKAAIRAGKWPRQDVRAFNFKAFTDAAETALPPLKIPGAELVNLVGAQVSLALAGTKSAEKALADAQVEGEKAMKRILAQMKRLTARVAK